MKLSKSKLNVSLGVLTGLLIGFVLGTAYGTGDADLSVDGVSYGNVSKLSGMRNGKSDKADIQKDTVVTESQSIFMTATDNLGESWTIEMKKENK